MLSDVFTSSEFSLNLLACCSLSLTQYTELSFCKEPEVEAF